ncbi:histone deacetylase [Nocardia canadensis]|uniref:histone deacetylase n=1 Tax=Nocardia canadensis TaxID=3065238 RepID=UPI002930F34C|nr:histone deacetylase [Nocardia canadensis]
MTTAQRVWYAAYGSNMLAARFAYYRDGGTPPGTAHPYPGFRDRTPPAATMPLTLPGSLYFAWQSPVWTGGVAFYADRPATGWPIGVAARGYLLTVGQFGDLLAQEMYRTPSADFDLASVLAAGSVRLGRGRYETVVHAGTLDGAPILTFTAPWRPETVDLQRPSARYVAMIAAGLRASHGWDTDRVVGYLAALPGIAARWHEPELRAAVTGGSGLELPE